MSDGRLIVSFAEMEDMLVRTLEHNTVLQERLDRTQEKLEDTQTLLTSALHELAHASKGEGVSVQRFVAEWYRRRGVRL